MKSTSLTLLTILMLSTSLLACGDDGAAPGPVHLDDSRTQPDTPTPTPEPQGYSYRLTAVDELPLRTHVGESVALAVTLTDLESGDAVSSQPVSFEIVQTLDQQTALLQTPVVTDAEGLATAQLHLGLETTGTVVVRVSHPSAQAIDLDVVVAGPQVGTIRVDIVEPLVPTGLDPYRIQVFPVGEFTCGDYAPRLHNPAQPARQVEVPTADPVDIEGFDPASYTVLAEALGGGGLVLAGGCADSVAVEAGQTIAIAIPLTLFPINPEGLYEVDGEWDISQVVSSANSTTATLVGVIDFMANPGLAIYTLVMDALDDALGVPVSVVADALFGPTVQATINDWLFQFAPIAAFSAVASDLQDMLYNLQVKSSLRISKTSDNAEFLGTERWTELTVNWTWRCQLDNPPPSCDQHTIDLQGTGSQAAAVMFQWTGFVDGYDRLNINSHDVTFDIGRLQLYLLNQVIIPDLTNGNAHTLGGALSYWIDCPGLAVNAAGQGIGASLIEAACNVAAGMLADFVLQPLEDQEVIVDLQLGASAQLFDAQPNGKADELLNGHTDGARANSSDEVHATWTAVRVSD